MRKNNVEMNDKMLEQINGGGVGAYLDVPVKRISCFSAYTGKMRYEYMVQCPYCDSKFIKRTEEDALSNVSYHCSIVHPIQDAGRTFSASCVDLWNWLIN